jgi:hypothetical protein
MAIDVKNPAHRAYLIRMAASMGAYAAVLSAVVWAFDHHPPQGPLRYGLAALPALPILGSIWAMGRYLVEEQDEYLRFRTIRAVLGGLGITLALATVWGFVETFAGGPPIPMYYIYIVFCAAMGLARCLP